MKRRILFALAVVIPLAIFVAARNAAGLRPELIYQSVQPFEAFRVSPQAHWMLCSNESPSEKVLVDLRAQSTAKLKIDGDFLRYVPDETAALFQIPGALVLRELPDGRTRQVFALPANFAVNDVHFFDDTLLAVNETALARWNLASGALLNYRVYNPNYRPLWGCGTGPNYYFSSAKTSGFSMSGRDGTWVRSGNNFFAVADGQPIAPLSPDAMFPEPRADVEIKVSDDILRIRDPRTGQILLSQRSIQHEFTPNGDWLLNREDERHIQLIDARNWKVVARRNFARGESWFVAGAPDFVLTTDNKGRVTRWRLR